MDFIAEKIRVSIEKLSELMETKLCDVEFEYLKCDGYKTSNDFPKADAPWKHFNKNDRFSGADDHYWMHFKIDAVAAEENKELIFSLKTGHEGEWDAKNPQGLVFLNGQATQALDVNHTWLSLDFDTSYDVYIYMYTGTEGGCFDVFPTLMLREISVYSLYFDIRIPYESMKLQDENSYDYIRIRCCLDKALMIVDFRHFRSKEYYESIDAARDFLKKEFYEKICGDSEAICSCIGHTHIDVAWLWTVAQTREKAERSFATVLNLMRRYPDYKFMSSQPQLYQHVKEANPTLYKEIKDRVNEGRWEVEGAMWLEADCNLISGESMVRQILHGKKFMKDEFGVDSRILWLPDVFGYSAALPQILIKSGVDRFFTSKISWNETNTMPHDTFIWKGIDGTEIFTSFIETYVKMLDPCQIKRTWDIYKDKELTNDTLVTFGHGDGGGGATAEMLENYDRLKYGIPGIPKTKIETAGEFFNKIESDFKKNTKQLCKTPKWDGELYLEAHRGTYTSMAKNKKNNRKSELLYQEAETLSVADMILCGGKYESELFLKNQINILLNQFHDIIPGSSIKAVYDVTDVEYERILRDGRMIADRGIDAIKSAVLTDGGIFVYNPSPFDVSGFVNACGNTYFAESVPAHGYKIIPDVPCNMGVSVSDKKLENDVICVKFDDKYQIVSIFDKEACREVLAEDSVANRLEIFEDYPRNFDAWEITDYYKQKMWICDDVTSVQKTDNGINVKRKYGNSTIEQEITLTAGSKRIDFITSIDWHEDHVLLKAAFPLDIRTTNAAYDIQFGNIERPTHKNTSWDEAKFEVCGHKWGDMSECGYGVSILNDCKYGYNAEENVFKLSLLKCATYPNPEADRGMNCFTYSLYPHIGDFREGKTIQEAYALNMPLEASPIEKTNGTLPECYSLIRSDASNVAIETIKKAEDSNSIIIRMYECHNKKSIVNLELGFDFKEAYLCNLLEENQNELAFDGREITVPIKNFEIITIKVKR